MRTIAYVTLIFLPGAFIAAVFGMSFFQFDPTTGKVIVAKTFWQYWAITLPVTLLVIAVWNVWNFNEKKKGIEAGKEALLNQRLNVSGPDMNRINRHAGIV